MLANVIEKLRLAPATSARSGSKAQSTAGEELEDFIQRQLETLKISLPQLQLQPQPQRQSQPEPEPDPEPREEGPRAAFATPKEENGDDLATRSKMQTWAVTSGLERIDEELGEAADTFQDLKAGTILKHQGIPAESRPLIPQAELKLPATANLHRGSEIFGPILAAIEASNIVENADGVEHSSLMKTIENLNVELGNLSLSEDVLLNSSPDKVPHNVVMQAKEPKLNTNAAMRELEELKNRIRNRRKQALSQNP